MQLLNKLKNNCKKEVKYALSFIKIEFLFLSLHLKNYRKSRFGAVLPTVDKVVQAIATRDNALMLPSGMTALNVLGLSTQVPMNYTYLTTGSERTIKLANCQVTLKRGVPKNFCYETRLVALLVQALRVLKRENIDKDELQTISSLISKEPDKESLMRDVDMMPAWMKRIVKPMLKTE